MKPSELRDMSDEQLRVMLKEAQNALFHLRVQGRMEKLDAPSELLKNKKTIARILTIFREREIAVAAKS